MLAVTREKDRLVIEGPFPDFDFYYELENKRYFKRPAPTVSCSETPHNIYVLARYGAEWRCDAFEKLKAFTAAPTPLTDIDHRFKRKPFPYQLEAFRRFAEAEFAAIFFEMGCGKTKVVTDIADYLYSQGKIEQLLVTAPNGVHRQWVEREIPSDMTSQYRACVYKSGRSLNAMRKELKGHGLKILTINIEALSHTSGMKFATEFMYGGKTMMVVDEGSTIKTPGIKRSKSVHKLGDMAAARFLLNGTPITKGVEDLFSQFKFLDRRILGMATYTAFKGQYCIMGGFENKQIVGYRNRDRLEALIKPCSMHIRMRDVNKAVPVPEKQVRIIEQTKEQAQKYKLIKDEALEYLLLEDADTINALTKLLRLRAVCGGYYIDEAIKHNRIEAVAAILDQTDGQVLIWTTFTNELLEVANYVAKRKDQGVGRDTEWSSYVYYGGNTGSRTAILNDWLSGQFRVLVANPKAGGVGLNLGVAHHVIRYTHDFSAYYRWQAEARTVRADTRHRVTYWDLVIPKTIEEKALAVLQQRKNIADLTLQEMRELIE